MCSSDLDRGKLMTNSLSRYAIPSREDVGEIIVEFAESYEPSGPYGAKSVGEIGIDTPPAAIANAIYNAIGVRLPQTPFTSDVVWKAILEHDPRPTTPKNLRPQTQLPR